MENKEFNYTYVAPTESERKEIESIKNQYLKEEKREETKLERLRRLDRKVKNTPVILSLCFGIIGTLIFGLGLTTVLEWNHLLLGVCIMAVGAIPVALAYPAYKWSLKGGKKKYGGEIVRLSEELLNGEE